MEEPTEKTDFERWTGKAYGRDFAPAVAGYVVVTLAVSWLIDFETARWWKYLAALLPIVPALWGARAIARHLGRIDEMHRHIHLTAMAAGFGVAMVASLTLAFLTLAGLESALWSHWATYVAGMATWAIVATRRGAPV